MMVCAAGLRAAVWCTNYQPGGGWATRWWAANGSTEKFQDGFTTAHVAWIRSRLPSPKGRASATTGAPRRIAVPLRVAAFGYEHL